MDNEITTGSMIDCKKCGKENDSRFWKCEACGNTLHAEPPKKKPANYIAYSVLLLLSLIPTAVISLYFGIKVNSSFNAGEYEKAGEYSKKSRLWFWISFILAIIATYIMIKYMTNMFNQYSKMSYGQLQDLLKKAGK